MKLLKKPGITLLAATLLLGLAGTGSGATVYLRDTPTPTDHFVNNGTESLKRSGVGTINGGNYWAGMLDFEMNLATSASNDAGWFSLWTYCIDPFRSLSVGPANGTGSAFTLMTLTDYLTIYTPAVPLVPITTVVANIEKLWANAFVESYQSATKAAAFQFLLWEFIGDGVYNPNSGSVKITDSAVKAQADLWYNSLGTWTERTNLQAISGLSNKQSFLYPDPRIPTNDDVPEPGTYAMLGAGLLAIAYVRRKK